jgi:hypothetical protein
LKSVRLALQSTFAPHVSTLDQLQSTDYAMTVLIHAENVVKMSPDVLLALLDLVLLVQLVFLHALKVPIPSMEFAFATQDSYHQINACEIVPQDIQTLIPPV